MKMPRDGARVRRCSKKASPKPSTIKCVRHPGRKRRATKQSHNSHAPAAVIPAALKMREAVKDLKGDLLLKIGIHEGPCLAVSLNNRQDYFGRTVNIAARVQGLATSRSIFATRRVVSDSKASKLLQSNGIAATLEKRSLLGMSQQVEIFEIP